MDRILQFVFYIGIGIAFLTGWRWAYIGAGVAALIIALLMLL